jgi:hypothetical protein
MHRRQLISLVGGAAAWPLAPTQQPTLPMIGYLSSASAAQLMIKMTL